MEPKTNVYYLQSEGYRLDLPLKATDYREHLDLCLDRRVDFEGVVFTNVFGKSEISEVRSIYFSTMKPYSRNQPVDRVGESKLVSCYANRYSNWHPNAFQAYVENPFDREGWVHTRLEEADIDVEFAWNVPLDRIETLESKIKLPEGATAIANYRRYYWGRDYSRRGGGRVVFGRYILPEFDPNSTESGIVRVVKSDEISSEKLEGCNMIHVYRYPELNWLDATYCNNGELP
jgi:hypothetical protein